MSVHPLPAFTLTPLPTVESRVDTVSDLLAQLTDGVHALLAERPKTAQRLEEVEAKVDDLVTGLADLLAATQKIAERLDAAEETDQ